MLRRSLAHVIEYWHHRLRSARAPMAESDVCSRPVQEPIMRHHSLNRLVTKLDSIISLSDAERTAILDLPIRVRDLAADQDIVREGDRPSQCCLVVERIQDPVRWQQ